MIILPENPHIADLIKCICQRAFNVIVSNNLLNNLPPFDWRDFEEQHRLSVLRVFPLGKQNVEYPVFDKEVVQEALYFMAVGHSGVLCVEIYSGKTGKIFVIFQL